MQVSGTSLAELGGCSDDEIVRIGDVGVVMIGYGRRWMIVSAQ